MTEADAIELVDDPVTVSRLESDLRDLGLDAGDAVLVHSSLSAIGWVSGGAQAVVEALQSVITEDGTLVMPTFTGQFTDPAGWENPPVPDHWEPIIRESRPAFRPAVTPTRGVGAVPECFRNHPGVHRSEHPEVSFAAWGAGAEAITTDHELDFGLGEGSPLARLYERDADVLRLGTGYETNTSFHLAEYRADIPRGRVSNVAPLRRDGERVLIEYEDIEQDTDDFPDAGEAFEAEIGSQWGTVGAADAALASQREMVDFAVDWFEENRT